MVDAGKALELARGAVDVSTRGMLYATDGRDLLHNDPDGWEISQPWLWWTGPPGSDGTGGPWGNPPPGASGSRGVLPSVSYCTNLIAGTLAGLPWRVQRGSDRLDTPAWIDDPQMARYDGRRGDNKYARPAEQMSVVDFRTQWITSALWFGDGYIWAPVRDASGQPKPPLWHLSPAKIAIRGGRYFVKTQIDIFSNDTLPEVEIPADQIIHLRGNPPYINGHGSGVIDLHGAELGLAAAVRAYAVGQFSSGVPAGFLKVTVPGLTQDVADDLKESWMNAHGSGRRSIAVLNATTDFTPIALSPIDAQLDLARQWSLRDVGLAFGVPASFLGIPGDPSVYSNVESRFIELRTYTLLNWIRRIEAALGSEFPYGTDVKIVTAGLERGDTTSRYQDYQMALTGGWLTVDEVRELEDLPPLPVAATPNELEGETV